MKLPGRTLAVVAAAAGSGLITFGAGLVGAWRNPAPTPDQLALSLTMGALVVATWVWPLVMYRDHRSEAFNLDEGVFVILALLMPFHLGILVFALAPAVAEAVRRHPPVKSVFNWAQVVTAAGLGLGVAHFLAPAGSLLTEGALVAAVAGALVFSVVNTATMALLGASLGTPWRRGALDGIGIRLRLAGSGVAVAILSALALSAYRWSLPLVVLPFIILRQVLAGHFQARHDRTRLLGLFEAALEANSSLGDGDPLGPLLQSARELLRCSNAGVRRAPPGSSELGVSMVVQGEHRWLVVSGRSRTEPFDAADETLLQALAAVGAGALTNTQLYREGRFQRERLAAITSSLGEGVCALDPSGRPTFVNRAAAAMLGWEAVPESTGPRGSDNEEQWPAIPQFLSAPALEVMRTRDTLRSEEEFGREDGTVLPVAFTASAILEDDQVAGAVIVFRDISERREAEAATRAARDQAIEASRLKSQFLANMSHEIRTPMNGVLGLSRILLDTDIDDVQRNYLRALRDCGESLMVIINDILDFSKIEAGKLDLEDVAFDLGASLTSVANAMAVAAHEKGLHLHLDVDPALPQQVRGDPVRLRQVLTNLVGNAIKFTHTGAVTVAAAAVGGERVSISVTDSGIGIDPASRAKVLGAFGQADSSTTRRYGGTGLGLAICSHLVGMMGGVLDFVSQPGHGSTFWFEIPLPEADETELEEPAVVADDRGPWEPRAQIVALHSADTASTSPGRILIADDAPVNRLVAARQLERLGYRVDLVTTGEEALTAVQRTQYDAVLMDCLMPVMDGYEATRRIRRLEGAARSTQIIAMTASAMVGDREECLAAGMDDYLSKPLNPDLLAEALQRAATTADPADLGTDGDENLGLLVVRGARA